MPINFVSSALRILFRYENYAFKILQSVHTAESIDRIFVCDIVEFESLQAFGSLEICGKAESVSKSSLLAQQNVGLHHISQYSLS